MRQLGGDPEAEAAATTSAAMQPAVLDHLQNVLSDMPGRFGGGVSYDPNRSLAQDALGPQALRRVSFDTVYPPVQMGRGLTPTTGVYPAPLPKSDLNIDKVVNPLRQPVMPISPRQVDSRDMERLLATGKTQAPSLLDNRDIAYPPMDFGSIAKWQLWLKQMEESKQTEDRIETYLRKDM